MGDDIKEMESIDVLGAYYQAQAKLKTNRRKNMYNQLMRYAAFLTIPLFLSSLVLGYLYFSGTETDEKYAEVVTATGSVIRYELPDHSVVWLNAGSTLCYPTTFKKDNRLVELKGCPILSKEKIDMAVIPCVSADREGRRLGHGAGFYDRFLDGVTFPKILVCYKELMMDQVPTEEHDILMDQVICDE